MRFFLFIDFTCLKFLGIVVKIQTMQKIIIKEIDRFYSRKRGKNYISEYLIYVTIDGINTQCFNEFGNEAKKERVNMLLLEMSTSLNHSVLNEIIEEITTYNK
jgi:hypothetical protein